MKIVLIFSLLSSFVFANSALKNYMQQLQKEAKKSNPNFQGFSIKRGEKIFFSKHIGKRGQKISCASCHTSNLKAIGENIFTGKKIKPLSPKANPKRLSNIKKVKKWLRRNFKDVYNREGTSQEKGDVLKFILNN